ncbi:3-phosphoshikimate 1-carboxyvinyltransferase [Desulfovibrio mangrovi]|uniref:3-phosphoshikimate 1-carboxyvinyltransferase n=1 Tax=Desulfovibrio mangrovi TaxID=2976983 RepID=UPI00224841E9|nr:3-phosphoshikimate 1-carboxyvinyltransferase [Desulfovibrio mangrovi]UZP67231.1 3-phosphoshikimate 1-carboxyvinyltransferase [Desulfovibrio mangrovi]
MKKNMTLVEEISEMDVELMKLLARRSKLIQKTRRPKKEGSGTTGISSEKQLRLLWEANATKFSKDPRLARQLFSLIQDIEFTSKAESDERTEFTLSPNRKPVNVDLPGPASLKSARLWMTLAAMSGTKCRLKSLLTADPVTELVKALNQAGASLYWQDGDVISKGGEALSFADKVIFAGDDHLNFYLLALMAAGRHGTLKFTGGSVLKDADLTAFRHFLPQLGARVAHVVPRSNGLPVRLECSGIIPDAIAIPSDLPAEAVVACLIAATSWDVRVTINLTNNANAETCLAEVSALLDQCGVQYSGGTSDFTIFPGPASVPTEPQLALDPVIGTTLLSVPVFTAGTVKLDGAWPVKTEEGDAALALLRSAGLEVTARDGKVIASATAAVAKAGQPDMGTLPAAYYPLSVAMACARAKATGEPVALPPLPAGMDLVLVEGFVAQAHMLIDDGKVFPSVDVPAAPLWTSPDANWTMAFAMLAFLKRSIKLANPGNITDLMPSFWTFYNGLPEPTMTRKPKQETTSDQPKRRRIIAE